MRISAIILAAGRGRRMASDQNKVFLRIAGHPLLLHTLRSIGSVDRFDEIVVVVRPGEELLVHKIARSIHKPVQVVLGGAQRRDSALAGVSAATGDLLLIHDGARPFPSQSLITRVIDGATTHTACIPALPVVDTVRYAQGESLMETHVERTGLVRIQTPQGFNAEIIRRALSESETSITDDAAAVLAIGGAVHVVPGESTNLKITTQADLPLAEAIASVLRV